ncbi:transcriptional regulator, HxlR family [Rothia dentocariosa ATCC 17931]|uniref:Transcriptional regulator, HxlR family n=1 Tax=Rothia dentocariosa (strain ATCC 17931 / CDC X599 / XDIA) TaxID=762948 RepID=E3H0Y3_ROTDC|nr:helix-turn-helix domain-containing protein [Rothia dentocariosa]ADP39986.1 transcriptional regulator, HxlR family [Rothia dentocariosa ATCC 17931]WMS30882.1 helix-turn-helix domain-containing protein [Rothia dentocariosa]
MHKLLDISKCCENNADVYNKNCPCRHILDRIADKWSALIIGRLQQGPQRFSELKRSITGITQKVLTQNLRTLERDGLVSRTIFPTVPVTVEYKLTPLGETLIEPLRVLRQWSEAHKQEVLDAQDVYDTTT